MMNCKIRTASSTEEQEVVALLTVAFLSDPAARWLYASPSQYLESFPAFIRGFGGKAFQQQTAHLIDGAIGAALWLPPATSPDEEALNDLFERTVPESKRDQLSAVFEQMGSHHPSEPHWYLPMIGVDPTRQGQGYGSALLAHALAYCDQHEQAAYLESSNPANIPLYQRHGFELTAEIRVGNCPPIFPMTRPPQTGSRRKDAHEKQPLRSEATIL